MSTTFGAEQMTLYVRSKGREFDSLFGRYQLIAVSDCLQKDKPSLQIISRQVPLRIPLL